MIFSQLLKKLYFIVQPLEIVQQTFEFSEEGKRAKNFDSDLNSGSFIVIGRTSLGIKNILVFLVKQLYENYFLNNATRGQDISVI